MSAIVSKRWAQSALVLVLDDGRKVRIAWEDGDVEDGIVVTLDGVLLDSDDAEADLGDVYAPTGLDIGLMMAMREEVFQRHLRDEGFRDEARNAHDINWRARRSL